MSKIAFLGAGSFGFTRKLVPDILTCPARVVATRDREQALEGADGVVCTILQGGVGVWRRDIETELAAPVDLKRGKEHAAGIFNALFGDGELYRFNGNLRNFGLIDNLPGGSCVEVPVQASPYGLQAIRVGALPPHLAALNALNAACEDLAGADAVEGDRRKIFHAVALDPLTSAVLSLEEIRSMVDEMFTANREYLCGSFKGE